MTSIALDPSFLFIDDDDWNDETIRDEFLEDMILILRKIKKTNKLKILWHESFDELHMVPYRVPYMQNRSWRNSLLQIIGKNLQDIVEHVEDAEPHEYSIDPKISYGISKFPVVVSGFENMIHSLTCGGNLKFAVIKNSAIESLSISCASKCSELTLVTTGIHWAECHGCMEDLWPSAQSMGNLGLIFDILLEEKANQVTFTEKFEKDVKKSRDLNSRARIMSQIFDRLNLSQIEACAHKGINDHPVKGTKKSIEIRRFKVNNGGARIHYQPENKGTLLFTDYFTEGEHDDGLP